MKLITNQQNAKLIAKISKKKKKEYLDWNIKFKKSIMPMKTIKTMDLMNLDI